MTWVARCLETAHHLRRAFRARPVRSILLVLIGLLLLLEGGLRLFFGTQYGSYARPLVYRPTGLAGYSYIPGARGTYCFAGDCREVQINPAGLVGKHHRKQRSSQAYRIALVGDDDGSGLWLMEGEAYAERLEAELREDGHEVEVYNFSYDGTSQSYGRFMVARDEVPAYSPDLVLVYVDEFPFLRSPERRSAYRDYVIVWDDAAPKSHQFAERVVDYIEQHRFLVRLHDYSFIARAVAEKYRISSRDWTVSFLNIFVGKYVVGGLVEPIPVSTRESLAVMQEAASKVREKNGTLILFGSLSDQARVTATERGFRFVNVKLPIADDAYNADGHYTAVGHQAIAKQLYAVAKPLVQQRLSVRAGGPCGAPPAPACRPEAR